MLEPLPPSVPDEVLRGLDSAARAFQELEERRVALRLVVDEWTLQLAVDVLDGRGNVCRRLPSSVAGELLAAGDVRGLLGAK